MAFAFSFLRVLTPWDQVPQSQTDGLPAIETRHFSTHALAALWGMLLPKLLRGELAVLGRTGIPFWRKSLLGDMERTDTVDMPKQSSQT
jgi:hypothetical protein